MKKCNSCGAVMADDCRFCAECGSSDIITLPEEPAFRPPLTEPIPAPQPTPPQQSATTGYPTGGYTPAQAPTGYGAPDSYQQAQTPAAPANSAQGYYAQAQTPAAPTGGYAGGSVPPSGGYVPPAGNGWQQPTYPFASGQPGYTPTQPVKKKHTGLIIAIVLGVLFILLSILVFVGARIVRKQLADFDPNDYINGIINEFEEDWEEGVSGPYSKGTLTGNVYVNEWAGLRFPMPAGFTNGSAEEYADYSDDYVDAAFVTAESDVGGFILLLEDMDGSADDLTEKEYLDLITDEWLDEELISYGYYLTDPASMTIADKPFLSRTMQTDGAGSIVQKVACRIYDDHVICFICWGADSTLDAFFHSITTP